MQTVYRNISFNSGKTYFLQASNLMWRHQMTYSPETVLHFCQRSTFASALSEIGGLLFFLQGILGLLLKMVSQPLEISKLVSSLYFMPDSIHQDKRKENLAFTIAEKFSCIKRWFKKFMPLTEKEQMLSEASHRLEIDLDFIKVVQEHMKIKALLSILFFKRVFNRQDVNDAR